MFEKSLEEKLKAIFKVKKITYDQPSGSREQEVLFIELENAPMQIRDGSVTGKVTASATLFGQADKVPFGFFSKAIKEAEASLTRDFFFYDLETNSKIYQNIVQRTFSFVYFFSSQYDPNIGRINSIDISVEEH